MLIIQEFLIFSSEQYIHRTSLSKIEKKLWDCSVNNYAYWWKQLFSKDQDSSHLIGQRNILRYVPHHKMVLRFTEKDLPMDLFRIIAAASTCEMPLHMSIALEWEPFFHPYQKIVPRVYWKFETEESFIENWKLEVSHRLRLLSPPSQAIEKCASENGTPLHQGPVLATGRLELLHYVREMSLSIETHRYGNLEEVNNLFK